MSVNDNTRRERLVNSDNGSELLTVPQLATYLGIAERTIFLWAQQDKLPAFKLGSMWRFRRSDIDRWMETQRSGPTVSNESLSITAPIQPPVSKMKLDADERRAKEAVVEACISYIDYLMEEKERSVWTIEQLEDRFGEDCTEEALKRLVKQKKISITNVEGLNGLKVKAINRR